MTPYFENYIAAMTQRDTVMVTLFFMALAIIAAWLIYTEFIRRGRSPKALFWGFVLGGFALYWGTVILYALEARK